MEADHDAEPLMSDYLRSREDMRRALSGRDFGVVFELLNRRGGVSLRALGAAFGMTASRVQEIIKGKRRITSIDVIERVTDALRVPGHQVGLAPRPWETRSAALAVGGTHAARGRPVSITDPGLPWHWEPAPTVEAVYSLTRSDLMLDRRQAVRAVAAAAGLPLIDPIQRWAMAPGEFASSAGQTGRIGEEEVARLENAARVFRSWDDSFGGGLARKAVIGQLNEVAELLRERHSTTITRKLFHVMSELAKIAATMSWDSGMQAAAQKYYVLALQAARPTGDRPLGANILAAMARQLLYLDRPNDALDLVRLAQDGCRGHATPRTRAMLYTREAWCYARLGRIEAFQRATGMAEDAFADVMVEDEDPYWIKYFSAAELAGVTGSRVRDLARLDRRHTRAGIAYIETALRLRDPRSMRSYALDQATLAQLHFLDGEVEQAVQMATESLTTARRTQSDRVTVKLRDLFSATTAHRHVPAVAELRENMREVMTS